MTRRPRSPAGSGAGRSGSPPEDEDSELWRLTSQTVEPLRRAKPRVPDVGAAPSPTRRPVEPATGPGRDQAAAPTAAGPVIPTLPQPRSGPPPLAQFERKRSRRIAAGRLEIEARLDLHGMRQSDAHNSLLGFLRASTARGLSTVLVITGKGGREAEDGYRPFNEDADRLGRGVLRRMVPLWLAEPEMRAMVTSFRSASARHGGEGALYLQLRKRKS